VAKAQQLSGPVLEAAAAERASRLLLQAREREQSREIAAQARNNTAQQYCWAHRGGGGGGQSVLGVECVCVVECVTRGGKQPP
jgi:hypothetical protein